MDQIIGEAAMGTDVKVYLRPVFNIAIGIIKPGIAGRLCHGEPSIRSIRCPLFCPLFTLVDAGISCGELAVGKPCGNAGKHRFLGASVAC